MLKIEKEGSSLLTATSFQPRDLEQAAATLPVRDDLLFQHTLVLIIPFTHQTTRTIAIDAEFGPYAAIMETRAITRKMGWQLTAFHDQLNAARRRIHEQMGLHGRPPRVIAYFGLFYFPLGRSETGGTIWIAGHYLKDLTIVEPHVVRAQFQTTAKTSFTVTLFSPTLPNTRRLSQLQAFAAAVTREMQPVLRDHFGLIYYGAKFSNSLPDNYAHLDLSGDPHPTTTPPNPAREQFEYLWAQLSARLQQEGSYIDLPELRNELLENLRHYQESD